jgi:hypothetical protein
MEEQKAMKVKKAHKATGPFLMVALFIALGCYHNPINPPPDSPAPLRMPPPGQEGHCNYEDSLTGGQIFTMYCGYCHFPRSLAERPFANYQTAAAHMRVVADLTGKEHAKLLEYLRRFHDVPPAGQQESPVPTRFFFSQPINELRQQQPKTAPDLQGGPRAGATSEASPGQPAPGVSPQEAR